MKLNNSKIKKSLLSLFSLFGALSVPLLCGSWFTNEDYSSVEVYSSSLPVMNYSGISLDSFDSSLYYLCFFRCNGAYSSEYSNGNTIIGLTSTEGINLVNGTYYNDNFYLESFITGGFSYDSTSQAFVFDSSSAFRNGLSSGSQTGWSGYVEFACLFLVNQSFGGVSVDSSFISSSITITCVRSSSYKPNNYMRMSNSVQNTSVFYLRDSEDFNCAMIYFPSRNFVFGSNYSSSPYKFSGEIDSISLSWSDNSFFSFGVSSDKSFEVINISALMWEILSMPFSFWSTAFNFTFFDGTPYAFNVSNLLISVLGVVLIVLVLVKLVKLLK